MPALIGQAAILDASLNTLRDCPSDQKILFESRLFDSVMQTSVFTSISSSDAKQLVAKEIPPVREPAGRAPRYDFRDPNCRKANVTPARRAKIQSLFLGERAEKSSP